MLRFSVLAGLLPGIWLWAGFVSAQTPVMYLRNAVAIAPVSTTVNTPTGYRLYVAGGILTERLRVADRTNTTTWADFVFAPAYRLRSLPNVAKYIRQHGHLPDMPSAREVQRDGIDVADTQRRLLQKVEELTLHAIRQETELTRLRREVAALKRRNR